MPEVRPHPCAACPYRCDVPSGLWAAEEYDKLTHYDKPTAEQPWATFGCHADPERYCHGWAVVHTNRGHEYDLLALRLHHADVPPASVPLFKSGTDAAAHGKREINFPSDQACETMKRLARKYPRLRGEK